MVGKRVRKRMTEEELVERRLNERERTLQQWVPKTDLGKRVQNGEIASLDEVFDKNLTVLEPEIVDSLVSLDEKVVDFKKTTRVVRAGRKFSFRVTVLVGDHNGHIGIGTAKDTEKLPAITKATKKAKLNMVRVRRGCGSWECTCGTHHSVPYKVEGKTASVRVILRPAPKGVGLVVGDNIKDVLKMAGVSDVWGKTKGATATKLNFVLAAKDAMAKTAKMKVSDDISNKFQAKAEKISKQEVLK